MPTHTLTILAPGLLQSPPIHPDERKALSLLLGRGDTEQITSTDYHSLLFNKAGYSGNQPAVAAFSHLLDANPADEALLMFASPTYCYADKDRVLMLAHHGLELTSDEAQQLCDEINAHLVPEGLSVVPLTPVRWYLHIDRHVDALFSPLPQVLGKDIHPFMPQGGSARYWRNLINELQMLLYASEVNQSRQARGALPVNTLWFWGLGSLPAPQHLPWVQVWADDPFAQGLAKHSGIPRQHLPVSAKQWFEQATAPGHHLLVMASEADHAGLVSEAVVRPWQGAWFSDLLRGLRRGRISCLDLWLGDDAWVSISTPQLLRFWRRRRQL